MENNNPVQQQNIPTPSQPKHHSFLTNKLFLITLAIAVLFTAVYAGIYLYLGSQLDQISKSNQTVVTQPSPTPLPSETSVEEGDPTANWKTYTDVENQYSVRYPSTWSIEKFSRDYAFVGGSQGIKIFSEYQKLQKSNLFVTIEVEKNTKNLSLDDFLNNYLLCGDAAAVDNKCPKGEYGTKIVIAGLPGRKLVNPPGTIASQQVIVLKRDKIFGFFVPMAQLKDDAYSLQDKETYFNQILSTFKFTPASPASPRGEPTGGDQGQTVCTQDAKLCPDGSYVSRQPPNCEFVACPQK